MGTVPTAIVAFAGDSASFMKSAPTRREWKLLCIRTRSHDHGIGAFRSQMKEIDTNASEVSQDSAVIQQHGVVCTQLQILRLKMEDNIATEERGLM